MNKVLNKIRALFNHGRTGAKSTIGKNMLSLFTLQISYYILPLITVPYLVRVLGPEKFGLVSFGQSLIAFLVLLVSFGFDFTATRKISVNSKDNTSVSTITSTVWVVKALLTLIGLVIIVLLCLFVDKIKEISLLIFILYGVVIGNMLFPRWLFQGVEKMGAIPVINIIMRAVATAGIFLLIKAPEDYLLYAGLLSIQWLGTGVIGVWYALARFDINFVMPTLKDMKDAITEGGTIFVSDLSKSVYFFGNSFILGILTNYTVVGYYSAAEKIIFALWGMFRPITNSFYPRFSKLASTSKQTVLLWGYRLLFVMSGLGLAGSVVLYLMAPFIVNIVLGKGYEPSIHVIQILCILLFLLAVSDVFSVQLMLPFGKDKVFTLIRVIAGPIHVVVALLLVPKYLESGMAFTFIITEIFIVLSTILYLWYCKLTPFHYNVNSDLYQKNEPVSSHLN
ncbi:MAG: flippase [Thermodesulfobacteriota bacterium]